MIKTLRLLIAAFLLGALPAAQALTLAPDAPERYVVQAGDTLWGLAGKYLADPWSWAQLWHAGAGIDNPNRIYPGDILTLRQDANGNPILMLEPTESVPDGEVVHLGPTLRSSALPTAIPTIPHDIVAAFMSRPTLLPVDGLAKLPYVVGFDHDRVAGAIGSRLYARGLDVEASGAFSVVHVGDRVKDPVSHHTLGYQAIYTGSARLDQAASTPHGLASLTLVRSARESLPGDRLVPETEESRLDFVPHAPSRAVDARIASVIDGVTAIGQYHVVLLNQGRRTGLEAGHVLTLWHESGALLDHGPGGPARESEFSAAFRRSVTLPAEPAGSLLVFRAYADASYALILETNSELRVGDVARSPNK